MLVQFSKRPEEGVGSMRTTIRDGCGWPHPAGNMSSIKALSDEPSLQPPVHVVFKVVSNSLFGMRHDTLIFKQTSQSYKLKKKKNLKKT